MKNFYKKTFGISSFDNLIITLYVIGYKNIGESIVVLFRDVNGNDENVIMSMVIDSYEKEGINIVRRILDKHNVSKLDFVCWTHPHCDHSLGIDSLVKDKFHNDIVLFIPKFFFGNLYPDLLKSESAKADEIFENINNLIANHPNVQEIWRSISANGDSTHPYPIQIYSRDGLSSKNVCFYFLTPLGNRIDQYAIKGNQFGRPNELSVSFVMSIDDYDFFFGGDTENEHADGINTEIIKGLRWVKVPHHCSLGAKSIAERLGPKLDFAASTVYKSSNLPQREIQEMYAKAGTLHMTQLEECGDYELQQEYGIVQYDYHFSEETTRVDVTTYGNAARYTPNRVRKPLDNDVE